MQQEGPGEGVQGGGGIGVSGTWLEGHEALGLQRAGLVEFLSFFFTLLQLQLYSGGSLVTGGPWWFGGCPCGLGGPYGLRRSPGDSGGGGGSGYSGLGGGREILGTHEGYGWRLGNLYIMKTRSFSHHFCIICWFPAYT